ncbi:hypothetical protein CXF68_16085 [Tenacibaculum sp. Bg11-29]|uniref:hypothetical protein n=1 Tax=Tenacibaculum sp. Bg11-29 TaxID=2058306 RepID=UPI000C3345A9|nr:hypothetical protein [Tenacibaculum sp. Bg11-29]PKH52116.1 hypothetical protein CXF68_16085 [Tenacibaculum sp. Bg11-29]
MKLFIVILLINFTSCQSQNDIIKIENDLERLKLKGEVKKITSTILKNNIDGTNTFDSYNFNKKGDILRKSNDLKYIEDYYYNGDHNKIKVTGSLRGTVDCDTIFFYNGNNCIKKYIYSFKKGKLNLRDSLLYVYDSKNRINQEKFYAKGKLDITSFEYNNQNLIVKKTTETIEGRIFYEIFKYNKNSIKKEYFSKTDPRRINNKRIIVNTFNKNGLIISIEKTFIEGKSKSKKSVIINYLDFDDLGNWIKCSTTYDSELQLIKERKIEYFD